MRKNNRRRRIGIAFALVFAMALTAVLPGAVFAGDHDNISKQGNAGGKSVIAVGDAVDMGAAARKYMAQKDGDTASSALADRQEVFGADAATDTKNENAPADDGKLKAAGYSYITWNPYNTVNIIDPANVVQQSGSMAGRSITLTFAGRNQAAFLATAPLFTGDTTTTDRPRPTQPDGFVAYMPASITYGDNNSSDSWKEGKYDDEWDTFTPPLTKTHTFSKAATFYNKVYYQKWTVQSVTQAGIDAGTVDTIKYWELDTTTKYCQSFKMSLKGMINFSGDGGGNKQVWVDNGSVLPNFTPKRSGFKFGGWYTAWPQGGTKMVPGKTKIWFGEGSEVKLYVHWDKKVPITYDANKGKIGNAAKKIVKVNYRGRLGKAPNATRSGYSSLGFYMPYKSSSGSTAYKRHDKSLIVNVAKATFKAQYIKNGKDKKVSLSEYGAITKANQYFYISKKNVNAAIGGAGAFISSGYYRVWLTPYRYALIPVDKYEWSGNKGSTTVVCYFINDSSSSLYNYLFKIEKDGGLK